jgi:hypothetical protein
MIYESIQDLKLPYFEVQYLDDDDTLHLTTLQNDDEVNFIKERFTILSKKKVG